MMEICDASAILALLKEEPGYEKVKKLFHRAYDQKFTIFIHQVNYIEVIKKMLKHFGETETKKIMAKLTQPFLGVSNFMNDEMATYSNQLLETPSVSMADSIGLAFTKIMEG